MNGWRIAMVLALVACARSGQGPRPPDAPSATDSARTSAARSRRVPSDSDWVGGPASRVEELFVGRFPGVQVLYAPGQGISVNIRGATSVMGSNQPLYVVDGFPMEPGPGGLLSINPSDIAKIEVLKDAGSIAEYGMRGANGVVKISTKRNR